MQPKGAFPPEQPISNVSQQSQSSTVQSSTQATGSLTGRSPWLRRLLWMLGFGTIAVASGVTGLALSLTLPLPEQFVSQESAQTQSFSDLLKKGVRYRITRPVNILVMGVDRVPEAELGTDDVFAGRSDTLMLAQVNPDEPSVNVLSIPRDTQVEFPGRRKVSKINHANWIGGPRLAADVVSYNLGNVEIDRYVRFSTEAFRELVDLLGGVEVFVPKPMQYDDHTQDLHIDLKQGWQVLDGAEAEQFARFRNDEYGDIGRVQRQQVLIRALRDRLTSPTVIPKIPQILQLLQTHIDTNLTSEELLALASFALNINQEDLRMVMLPGRFSQQREYAASYWIMDRSSVSRVMEDYFGISPITYASSSSLEQGRSFSDLHIAVQNASSHPQLASEVAQYLRERGFSNVYVVQDWPEQNLQTQIIVQRGYLQGATRMEHILGVGDVLPTSTGDLASDLTIRVGNDWLQRPDMEL